jgi:hypothetical protein
MTGSDLTAQDAWIIRHLGAPLDDEPAEVVLDQARLGVQACPPSEVTYREIATAQLAFPFAHDLTVVCATPLAASWKLIESGEIGRPDM